MLLNNVIFSHSRRVAHQWLPALIGALGTLAGGAVSAIGQSRQNKKNVQSAKDLAQYQWQNFDSPMAQKAAYQSAGINPFAQGQLGQAPQMQVPDQAAPGAQFGAAVTSFIQPLAQLLAVSSQIKQLEAQTDMVNAQKEGVFIDNDLKRFDLGEFKPAELKKLEADISATQAGEKLTRQEIKNAAYELIKMQAEKKGIDLDNLMKEMDNEWKKRQMDKRMPELQVENLELQNSRLHQDYQINENNQYMLNIKQTMLDKIAGKADRAFEDLEHANLGNIFSGETMRSIISAMRYLMLFKIFNSF